MFEAIGNFFGKIGSWIRGLFSSEEEPLPTQEPIPDIKVGPLEPIGIEPDEPVLSEPEPEPEQEPEETPLKEDETTVDKPDMNSTPANDATADGIIEAYFAKKVKEKVKTEEAGAPYTYTFIHENTISDANKGTIAGIIETNSKAILEAQNEYLSLPDIVNALQNITYAANSTLEIPTKKLEEREKFEKIDSSSLEKDIYVFAKTGNLDSKEITITIQEKEEFLLGANAPLPVLKRDDTSEEVQKSEDLDEITELKETIEDGMVSIPIRLRPKSDDTLKEWQDKIAKGKEDGTYTYTFSNTAGTTITAENKTELAGIIATNSNEGKLGNTKVEDGKKAYADDVEKVLEEKTYSSGDQITFPIYKILKEYLWLKASAQGDEELHEKEFLNETETSYFKIGGCPRCGRLTLEELNEVFPDGDESEKTEIMNAFNEANDKFGLDTCQQKAHFFAQVREEVGTSINISNGESLNYAATALPQHFTAFSSTNRLNGPPNALAMQYGRSAQNNYTSNQEMIANIAYANRNGNGDRASGDGWRYRGKGIIQVTGKDKYDRINDRIDSDFPTFNIDIDANNINNLREGTVASMAYWEDFGCQEKAAEGITQTNVNNVINIVNSRTPSRQTRWEHFQRMLVIFKVNECNGDGNSEWHHPLDRMELRGWYNSGFYPDSSDHGDASIRVTGSHDGLDLYAPIGTQVYACVDGEIYDDYISGSYGNTLGIKGEYNGTTYYFFYAHLSERDVAEGATVSAGDPIGKTGKSGNASGQVAKMNHLHFEVRSSSSRTGGRLDPLATISELQSDVDTSPDQNNQTGT